MARKVLRGSEAREAIARGVDVLADAVVCTLGPKGRCVILEKIPLFPPTVTKDGVSVAKEVRDLEDPFENIGANLIREAAIKTSNEAGDGTTTATLLARAIYRRGSEMLANGANPQALKRGIDAAVACVVEHIASIAQPVTDDETIARVGTISSNGDRAIGEMIAEAMRKVGRDGVITISESSDSEDHLQVTEGMQIDRGWLAPAFVTDPERLDAVLHDAAILITERKLYTFSGDQGQRVSEVLAEVGKQGRPVLIIASDYDQPFVVTLIHNKQNGFLNSVPVKAPAFGELRRALLEDLAIVTGAYAFTEDCGRQLDSLTIEDLGSARRVVVHGYDSHGTTTIEGGNTDTAKRDARVDLLRSLIPATENDLERERLKQRLAKLSSGVAVIKVGAGSETERKEKQDRVDDAVCATRAAVQEGIVPGGGLAFLLAQDAVEALSDGHVDTDEQKGMFLIYTSLADPLRQICANAGADFDKAYDHILDGDSDRFGYNAATGRFENLIESGVIDPAKVVRCALVNAASVASTLLLTEASVCQVPEKRS